jgi:hypothetical protein
MSSPSQRMSCLRTQSATRPHADAITPSKEQEKRGGNSADCLTVGSAPNTLRQKVGPAFLLRFKKILFIDPVSMKVRSCKNSRTRVSDAQNPQNVGCRRLIQTLDWRIGVDVWDSPSRQKGGWARSWLLPHHSTSAYSRARFSIFHQTYRNTSHGMKVFDLPVKSLRVFTDHGYAAHPPTRSCSEYPNLIQRRPFYWLRPLLDILFSSH